MKNQTKRVDDALAQSKNNRKKPVVKEPKKTPQELEASSVRRLMKVDNSVWGIINKLKAEQAKREAELYGDPLDSPFKTESARIKAYTKMYADSTIAEAFTKAYGIEGLNPEIGDELPTQLSIGSVVKVSIQAITKKGIVFNSGVYKDTFISRNNPSLFEQYMSKDYNPGDTFMAKVVDMTPAGVVIDIIGQMVDDFIAPRANTPWKQNQLDDYEPVTVRNLKLVRGGYLGKAVIPNVSKFVGHEMTVNAFIPGSQIVLNATDNFEQFEGKDVKAFITAWSPNPRGTDMTLICSVKNALRHVGNLHLMSLHSLWCDADEKWASFAKEVHVGKITGVINSSKKCGVFVELPDYLITGMVKCKPEELVNYKAGDKIKVHFTDFDEELRYQSGADQYQHIPAFEIEGNAIKKVNIKPIFEVVE